MKRCNDCGLLKEETEFRWYLRHKVQRIIDAYCKPCRDLRLKRIKEAQKAVDTSASTSNRRLRKAALRAQIVEALGGKCKQCDSTFMLQIDHINGGGGEHREALYGPNEVYLQDILTHLDLYQLLCIDCHKLKTLQEKIDAWLDRNPDKLYLRLGGQ